MCLKQLRVASLGPKGYQDILVVPEVTLLKPLHQHSAQLDIQEVTATVTQPFLRQVHLIQQLLRIDPYHLQFPP